MSTFGNNRKKLLVVVSLMIVAVIMSTAHRADRTAASAASQAPRFSIVGTWEGKDANIIDFRSDGTGRYRFRDSNAGITYIEWESNANSLDIVYASSDRGIVATARRLVIGRGERDHYDLQWIGEDNLQLIDPKDRKAYLFKRCSDPTISEAR